MAAYLLASRHLTPEMLTAATNEGGLRPLQAVPSTANVGALALSPGGPITAAPTETIEIVDDGDVGTATFKRSVDAGANWLGRKVATTWDTNGGTGTIKSGLGANPLCSRVVLLDTDDDGFEDTAFIATIMVGTASYAIYKTTDLTGAGAWTEVATGIASADGPDTGYRPALVAKDGALYLFFITSVGPVLKLVKSVDNGATFAASVQVVGSTGVLAGQIDAILLRSGRILVGYIDNNSDVACSSTSNGANWRVGKVVKAGTFASCALVQTAAGTTYALCEQAATGITGRQCTDADPARSTATWAAWSVWDGAIPTDADDTFPSMCLAPNGSIFAAWKEATSDAVEYSTLASGGTAFAAKATAHNPGADVITCPWVSNIGGAIWMPYADTTNDAVELVLTRYWTAYDASTAPASWTGAAVQYLTGGLWLAFGGADGYVGDSWTIGAEHDYGADRSIRLMPQQPTRATGDGADWSAAFDLGASVVVPIDTVAAIANVEHLHHQQDAAATFDSGGGGAPTVNTTLSFVQETVASAGVTWAAGKATRAAGSWGVGTLAGKRVRAGTSGQVQVIDDNDATSVYVHGVDMSAYTGDLQVLSDRAWATQTAAAARYLRQWIDSQETAENRYEIAAYAAGTRFTLTDVYSVNEAQGTAAEQDALRDGTPVRTYVGQTRRAWIVDLCGMSNAEKTALAALFAAQGTRPLVFIPDSTNAFDFSLVLAPQRIAWDSGTTSIELVEVG